MPKKKRLAKEKSRTRKAQSRWEELRKRRLLQDITTVTPEHKREILLRNGSRIVFYDPPGFRAYRRYKTNYPGSGGTLIVDTLCQMGDVKVY